MKAYILSIAGAVLFSAVVCIILPEGKMGKFIKGGLKLVVLLVLVAPFVSFFSEGKYRFSNDGQISLDGNYLETCTVMITRAEEREIGAFLKEKYGVESKVVVSYSADGTFTRKKISLTIVDFGIYEEDEHIDIMKKIANEVESSYGCETEVS